MGGAYSMSGRSESCIKFSERKTRKRSFVTPGRVWEDRLDLIRVAGSEVVDWICLVQDKD
jgi:hypothetical protein